MRSARDADGYVALFTDDAVMDGDMGRAKPNALSETVSRVWAAEPRRNAASDAERRDRGERATANRDEHVAAPRSSFVLTDRRIGFGAPDGVQDTLWMESGRKDDQHASIAE